MRWLAAFALLMACLGAARADIRINVSRYSGGTLTVAGETSPGRAVTLDDKFKTESDGAGRFSFILRYKPPTCMSDIRAGEDVYSAVIAGCLDAGDVDGPLPDDVAKPRRASKQ
jgi:hypothetical protein